MLASLILVLFLSGLLFAAAHDVATMTIPNWVSLAFIGVFPLAALLAGLSWSEIGLHGLAALIGFVVCLGLFLAGVFGGGDAKLLPAVLLWIGAEASLTFVYGVALSGGLLAALILLSRKCVPETVIPGFLHRSVVVGPGVPYAVAIACGALWAAPKTPFFLSLIAQTGLAY